MQTPHKREFPINRPPKKMKMEKECKNK